MGNAMMGSGEAEGEGRASRAAEDALCNPLLGETSIQVCSVSVYNQVVGSYLCLSSSLLVLKPQSSGAQLYLLTTLSRRFVFQELLEYRVEKMFRNHDDDDHRTSLNGEDLVKRKKR